MKNFKLVFFYIKKYKLQFILGFFCLIVCDGLQMIIPKVIQHSIDGVLLPGFRSIDLVKYGLLIILLAIVIAIFRFLWRIFIIGNARIIERDIRNDFYAHLQKLSARFFQNHKTGDIMAHATNDMNAIRMLIALGIVIGVDIIVYSAASLFFMINIDFRLTMFVIIPLPLLTFIIIYFGKIIHKRFRKVQDSFSSLTEKVQETISGIRVIKSFAQEDSSQRRVSKASYDYVEKNISLVKVWGLFFPALVFIIGISIGLTLIIGGRKTILNEISFGEFVAFNSYLAMLVWPMIAIGWVTNLYQRGSASMKRINNILYAKADIIDRDCVNYNIYELNGSIEFRHLNFNYEENEPKVMKDVSFSVSQGETLAIVGRTGAGKTSIINLLTRKFDPPENTVFIDGYDIFEIPLQVLRNDISIVPQDIFLFSDTVKENIKFAKQNATDEEIFAFAKAAQIYDEVMDFKDQFDSIIGEKGVSLSGGQKQRIAIARALLADPKILILDDALSSVDTETEKKILTNLIKLRKSKTTIMIAHRISTLQHADKIIVIDEGKIIEQGNHQQLLKNNGLYANIYKKQQIEEHLVA